MELTLDAVRALGLSAKDPAPASPAQYKKLPNRSMRFDLPETMTRAWIDDIVLEAHYLSPVWRDRVLVEQPPVIGELGVSVARSPGCYPLLTQDGLIVITHDAVETLITVTTTQLGQRTAYQLDISCFRIDAASILRCATFHELAARWGVIAYPDSELIDKVGSPAARQRMEDYIGSKQRQRPVFIIPKPMVRMRRYLERKTAIEWCASAFGLCFSDQALFAMFSARIGIDVRIPECIAIGTDGTCAVVGNDHLTLFEAIHTVLDPAKLLNSGYEDDPQPIGTYARRIWAPHSIGLGNLDAMKARGAKLEKAYHERIDFVEPEVRALEPVEIAAPEIADTGRQVGEPATPIELDSDGYPINSSDVVRWASESFPDTLNILPRARRSMAKSSHPFPARIAAGLEALATIKARVARGDRGAVRDWERSLNSLRMTDGHSNGDRLKGQTGEDYIVTFEGRRLILDRHLRSNSSVFNDPKLIRIYYTFDRVSQSFVVGWLPSHLQSSQS